MDWWQIVLGLAALAGAIFGGGKAALHKKVKQLRELARSMDEALMETGPGGVELTKAEILDIWNDVKALMKL